MEVQLAPNQEKPGNAVAAAATTVTATTEVPSSINVENKNENTDIKKKGQVKKTKEPKQPTRKSSRVVKKPTNPDTTNAANMSKEKDVGSASGKSLQKKKRPASKPSEAKKESPTKKLKKSDVEKPKPKEKAKVTAKKSAPSKKPSPSVEPKKKPAAAAKAELKKKKAPAKPKANSKPKKTQSVTPTLSSLSSKTTSETATKTGTGTDLSDRIASANLDKLKSIASIVKFMDEIEPDKKYYERQQDKKGECSKLRRKLREYTKKNEGGMIGNSDIAMAYFVKHKWAPPTHDALGALIDLLRDMIDKTWPN